MYSHSHCAVACLLALAGTPAAVHGQVHVARPPDRGICGVPPWNAGPLEFYIQPIAWTGNGLQAISGRAQPAQLTYSFPADGVPWFNVANAAAPNNLNARLVEVFGNQDLGREYIRQSIAGWRRYGGLQYHEVADDNAPWTTSTARVPTRGDIRIAGAPVQCPVGFCTWGVNYYPGSGGDMTLNTSPSANYLNPFSNYRRFRNLVAHEHGHGLGFIHPTPCDNSKVMEPTIVSQVDLLQLDDIRGVGRNYGDRLAGNHTSAAAADLGNLSFPALRSVIHHHLSLNGSDGFGGTSEDWFRFTLGSPQSVVIQADPSAAPYPVGLQSSGCEPSAPPLLHPAEAGRIALELRDAVTSAVISTGGGVAGAAAQISSNLPAGQYLVRVRDLGPNPIANQIVQHYRFTLRVGASFAPPYANAGLNKRIHAGHVCYFMGHINSAPAEAGAVITRYDWDLDGDGFLDTFNQPMPQMAYTTPGTRTIMLQVTDSNGRTATDSILVEVYGEACYPDCDVAPGCPGCLNFADFSCFLAKFAAGDLYANCDQSTVVPVLNVADFGCFLAKFAAGCP